MKIRHPSVLVILTLFAGHSARGADWEVVGFQYNSTGVQRTLVMQTLP